MIRAWLSRQRNGDYMVTSQLPILAPIGHSEEYDWYVRAGDILGLRHLCPGGVKLIWGVDIKPLESVRIWIDGGQIAEEGGQ